MQKTRWDDRILSDSMIPPPPPFNSRSWLRPTWELGWFQFRPKQIRFKFQLELITSSSDYGKWLGLIIQPIIQLGSEWNNGPDLIIHLNRLIQFNAIIGLMNST